MSDQINTKHLDWAREILAFNFEVMEPNGADIPEHLDAYIAEIDAFVQHAQNCASLALAVAGEHPNVN